MGCQNSHEPDQTPLAKTEVTENEPEDYGSHIQEWLAERGAVENELDACEHKGKNWNDNILKIFKNPGSVCQTKKIVEDTKKAFEFFSHYMYYSDSTTDADGGAQEVKSLTYGDVLIPAAFLPHSKSVDASGLSRKYLLLKDTSDPNSVWTLLAKTWNLPEPNLVVSLISSKLYLNTKTEKHLNELLAFLAKTETWMLSDGMHMGSSLLLSKAVRIGGNTNEDVEYNYDGLTLIGITQWNDLRGTEKKLLYGMSLEGIYDSYYFYPKQNKMLKGEVDGMANPYQNAYLFESTSEQGVTGSMRDNLVQSIRNEHPKCDQQLSEGEKEGDDGAFRPAVSLVIGGSEIEEILTQIKNSVEKKFPVVIVRQSGDATEEVFRIYDELEEIKQRCISHLPGLTEKEQKKLKETLKYKKEHLDDWKVIMKNRHYLTFIKLGEKDMISKFIAGTLKGKKHIQCMSAAMLTESYDFLKAALFREIDPEFDEFLEHTSLSELEKLHMMNLKETNRIRNVLFDAGHMESVNTLPMVGKMIFKMMGWQYLIQYQEVKQNDKNDQLWHLFQFAILSNKCQEIIELLASLTESPLGAALFAYGLLRAMSSRARKVSENVLEDDFQRKSDHFHGLAEKVLHQMYVSDASKAYNALNKKLPFRLGERVTVLTLAIDSNAKRFLKSPCCQTYIMDKVWHRDVNIPLWKRIVAVLLPVLSWLFLFEKEDTDGPSCMKQSKCQKSFCKKPQFGIGDLKTFYSAPATKYAFDLASFIVFLALLSCFVLIDLMPVSSVSDVTPVEWLTYCFVAGKILEEFVQIIRAKGASSKRVELAPNTWSLKERFLLRTKFYNFKFYFSEGAWNTLDLTMLFLFTVSTVYRFTVSFKFFQIVRIMFSLTMLLAYTRILKYFYVFENIGPRVIAITLMLTELLKMCLVLVVFIFAFGAAFQAVENPGQLASWETLANLAYRPYWQMYGELFIDDASSGMGRDTSNFSCSFLKENGYPELHCFPAFPFILIAVYLIISNVLLLNMVIAIFGNTLSDVEKQAKMHWAYQKCVLTREYYYISPLPPPLNIIWYILMGVRKCCNYIKGKKDKTMPNEFLLEPCNGVKKLEQRAFMHCLKNRCG